MLTVNLIDLGYGIRPMHTEGLSFDVPGHVCEGVHDVEGLLSGK